MSRLYRMGRTNLCERYLCVLLFVTEPARGVISYFMSSTCSAALIMQNNSHATCHIISNL
jgi:hypothetical protein